MGNSRIVKLINLEFIFLSSRCRRYLAIAYASHELNFKEAGRGGTIRRLNFSLYFNERPFESNFYFRINRENVRSKIEELR